MWLTSAVLLPSLIRFGEEQLVSVVKLIDFEGFLNGASLEDGDEEVAIVGEYFCPSKILSVRGFGVSISTPESPSGSKDVFRRASFARLPEPQSGFKSGRGCFGVDNTYSFISSSCVRKSPVIFSKFSTHILDTRGRRPRSLVLVHSRTLETMAAQSCSGHL